jgi:RNA polymerase sigma-70 factor (ECF subfamily)
MEGHPRARMTDSVENRAARESGSTPGVLVFRPAPTAAPAAHDTPDELHRAAVDRALDAIHARLYEPLRTYACAYTTRDDAEDAVQAAFVALWDRHFRHGVDANAHFDAFLFNTVRWRIVDSRRNRRTMRENLRSYLRVAKGWIPRWMRADGSVSDERLGRVISQALEKLGPRSREVWVLRYQADFTVTEIAAMAGVSRGTVTNLLSRASAVVRRDLEHAGYAPARDITAGTRRMT